MRNWIHTTNPFNLAKPPLWFLRRLHAYDTELVIFASTSEPVYRMGRRGRYGTGMLAALKGKPDTAIYVANRVWPWKSVLPETLGGDWNRILLNIADYDTQDPRFADDPGAELDAAEEREEAAADRRIISDLDALNSESYRLMQLLTGSRVGAGARPEGAGFKKLPTKSGRARRSPYRPRNYQSAGAMFVGR